MNKKLSQIANKGIQKFSNKKHRNLNPNTIPDRTLEMPSVISVTDFDADQIKIETIAELKNCFKYFESNSNTWINIDGIKKNEIDSICAAFNIHPLIQESIISINQRPKFESINDNIYCVLYMIYYDKENKKIEYEQVSLILGKKYVISVQEEPLRDVFSAVRDKLNITQNKVRKNSIDYLYYLLLDTIIDNYFIVFDQLLLDIEILEEEVVEKLNHETLGRINYIRKEFLALKRHLLPVKELTQNIVKSESELLSENTEKYYRDILDHANQINDSIESIRDEISGINELYLSITNLRLNEVMKVLAIVTTLLAPLTVITGIYGMNFEFMPELHSKIGYPIILILMSSLFFGMIYFFKKRNWF